MRGHVALEKQSLKQITFKSRISTRKKYEAFPESEDNHVQADREFFYAYYAYTAVDLHPLPVSRARLTVVESALFE